MRWKRVLGWVSALAGGVCALLGLLALKWYVWDIVIGQMGEPDRSMIFWGLPVVFIGLTVLGLAVGFWLVARHLLRQPHP